VIDRLFIAFLAVVKPKLVALTVCVLVVGGLLAGCGSDQATDPASNLTDKQILAVPQGASLAVVEDRLGEPSSEVTTGEETVFNYGPWRLVAEEGHLARRIKSRRTTQGEFTIPSNREERALDQKILAIKPGTSIAKVRGILGAPEQDEEVFEGIAHPVVVLGYGAWELSFRNGVLKERAKS
jgi:hypothetical protein